MFSDESYFVLYGAVFASALIACRYAVKRADRTDQLPVLSMPAQVDPYEVAYLRGGRNAVERLAILNLLESGHLSARRQEASFWRSRPAETILEQVREGQGLPWHLSSAWRCFSKPQGAEAISGLWDSEWSRLEKGIEERLKKDQLLATDETRQASTIAITVSLIVLSVLSVPILPVIMGLFSNALGFWVFVTVIFVFSACDPGRLSKRGETYLVRLQNAYREKTTVTLPWETAVAGATFTLVIEFALFGGEALKDTTYEHLDVVSDSGDSGDGGDGDGGD